MLRRLLISILLTTSISASADEVEDQINLGLESYKNKEYKAAVDDLMAELARLIVRDGEGATKFVTINVTGAASARAARRRGLRHGA